MEKISFILQALQSSAQSKSTESILKKKIISYFSFFFFSKKRFTDYVRRRRWTRKCRLISTGPWRSLGSTRLVNVSMKPHLTQDLVYVWAVTAKGEALFRTGVSSKCPEGLDWTHVSSDVAFQSITISGKGTDTSPLKVCMI